MHTPNIDVACLGTLLSVLKDDGTSEIDAISRFELLYHNEESTSFSPMVIQMPTELIELLSNLSDDRLDPIADMWANTEFYKSQPINRDGLSSFLKLLRIVCYAAKSDRTSILIWTSL